MTEGDLAPNGISLSQPFFKGSDMVEERGRKHIIFRVGEWLKENSVFQTTTRILHI